jgi:hypothetical protein
LTGVIQLLVDRGAAIEAINKAGQTPLALTMPREGRQSRPDPERAARAKAAETLLRSLGATR